MVKSTATPVTRNPFTAAQYHAMAEDARFDIFERIDTFEPPADGQKYINRVNLAVEFVQALPAGTPERFFTESMNHLDTVCLELLHAYGA